MGGIQTLCQHFSGLNLAMLTKQSIGAANRSAIMGHFDPRLTEAIGNALMARMQTCPWNRTPGMRFGSGVRDSIGIGPCMGA